LTARDVEVVVAEDPAALVAERLAELAQRGGSVVLTGGSTPRLAYEQAASLAPDWSRVEVYWGDERCVPPEHPDSNYGMAKAALLDRLAAPPMIVHRMRGELGREEGAEAYETEIGHAAFDLVLLGLGPDGHVASLYPEQPTLRVTDRRVIGAEAHLEPFVDRITLTLPTLCGAGEVLFLVSGGDKADAVARALEGDASESTPGSLVRSETGRTWAVLDAAAASQL
jgi:6-phosphogluconolactonase